MAKMNEYCNRILLIMVSTCILAEASVTTCDFELDFCSLVDEQAVSISTAQWQEWTGPAPARPYSGPDVDHTLGNETGSYYMVDSTQSMPGSSAVLVSNKGYTKPVSIAFYYHMFGENVGILVLGCQTLDGQTYPVWTLTGNQGDAWHHKSFNFTPSDYNGLSSCRVFIVFSILGYNGTAALDDITVNEEAVSSCSTDGTYFLSNPRPDEFTDALAYYDSTKCTVTFSSNMSTLAITQCTDDYARIIIIFQNGLDGDGIVGGDRTNVGAYILQCIANGTAWVTTTSFENMRIEKIAKIDGTFAFSVISSIRNGTPDGQVVTSAFVGQPLVWAIDFPGQYKGIPEQCTARPAFIETDDISVDLISSDGCSSNKNIVGDFTSAGYISIDRVSRYYTYFISFAFPVGDYVLISCTVRTCTKDSASCQGCGDRRKRDYQAPPITRKDRFISTSTVIKVESSAIKMVFNDATTLSRLNKGVLLYVLLA